MTDLDRLKAAEFEEGDSPPDTEAAPMPRMLVEVKPDPSPLALVAEAIAKGHSPAELHALLDFAERVKKDMAAEKYAKALARFQAECPQILKTRQVKFGENRGGYKFASYDDIDKVIAPLLRACEIVISFSFDKPEGNLLMGTCRVQVGSHIVPTTLPVPFAKGQNTNAAQDLGVTITYAKRYLLCAALNIRITDNLEADTDGTTSSDFISDKQLKELKAIIGRVESILQQDIPDERMQQFLGWLQVESLDKLPVGSYQKAFDELCRWQKKAEEQKARKK